MQKTSQQYDEVTDECRSLYIDKMTDYGSAWRILRLPSLTDQIFIKAQRIRQLQENNVRKVDEDEIPEFIGIINYSVMALIQIEKGIAEQPDLNVEEATKLFDKHISITKQLMEDKNHDYRPDVVQAGAVAAAEGQDLRQGKRQVPPHETDQRGDANNKKGELYGFHCSSAPLI